MTDFRKDLENSFEELGVVYDNTVLQKCLDICEKYGVTEAEDFVDTWMAYSLSHLHGENPTVNNLIKFEREEFTRKTEEVKRAPEIHAKSLTVYEASQDMDTSPILVQLPSFSPEAFAFDDSLHRVGSLPSYLGYNGQIFPFLEFSQDCNRYITTTKFDRSMVLHVNVHSKAFSLIRYNSDEASSIIRAYNETTPRRTYSKNGGAPDGCGIKRSRNYGSSPQAAFSPAGFSPSIATPSSKYVSRTNSGDIVLKFNDNEPNREWKTQEVYLAKIELNSKTKIQYYMSFDLVDCLDYANNTIEKLGSLICTKYSLEDVMPVRYKHPSPFVIVGRIACDADGRLNSKSVLLEGSSESSLGKSVYLDLSGLQKYSLFPGQVVAVKGYNLTGDKLIVKEIYNDASPDLPRPYDLPRGTLNVMIAAGPYTQSDSMTYQPLLDLIDVAVSNEPHALILTGPLIDSNHPVVLENTMAETYEDFLGKLIDKIMKPLEKKRTQVIIVNSSRDCSAHNVYPTPQLSLKTRSYPKLHTFPDPSVFTLEDVLIGITSTDILLHLSKEEISCSPHGAGRLPRMASHLLEQRSFYPLNPATEIPLDPTLIEFAKLDVIPHILILPSDLRYFIKEVCGSIVINPERLAKGVIGGTYARLIISKSEIVGNIVKI